MSTPSSADKNPANLRAAAHNAAKTKLPHEVGHKEDILPEAEEVMRNPSEKNINHNIMPADLAGLSPDEYNRVGKKATRKLDIFILPILTLMYILNYLDRQNISAARLAGLEEDLGLSTVEYQTAVSILFAGYILMQVPSNMIAQRVKAPGVYICVAMGVWGMLSAATAGVNGAAGLMVVRFILGFIESVFFPGALFYLSLFYNRKQFAVRTAILYSGSQLGNAFGGLFAVAILQLDGAHGIAGWKWLFIVEGVLTIGLAIIFAFILPSSRHTTRILNELERSWVNYEFDKGQSGSDKKGDVTIVQGLLLAIRDPKTWMMMGILSCTYICGAVVQFFPSVVQTLGYGQVPTLLLTAPPYCLCVIVMIINGFHSDRVQERFWHILWPFALIIVANVIALSTLNTAARYVAMMLMPTSFYASAIVTLSWITSCITLPTLKRAIAIALINSFANTPNVWCSYLYTGAPKYTLAFSVNLAAGVAAAALAVITRIYLGRENKKLDRGEDTGKSGPTEEQVLNGFRYPL